jgi:hypothetical protein
MPVIVKLGAGVKAGPARIVRAILVIDTIRLDAA